MSDLWLHRRAREWLCHWRVDVKNFQIALAEVFTALDSTKIVYLAFYSESLRNHNRFAPFYDRMHKVKSVAWKCLHNHRYECLRGFKILSGFQLTDRFSYAISEGANEQFAFRYKLRFGRKCSKTLDVSLRNLKAAAENPLLQANLSVKVIPYCNWTNIEQLTLYKRTVSVVKFHRFRINRNVLIQTSLLAGIQVLERERQLRFILFD